MWTYQVNILNEEMYLRWNDQISASEYATKGDYKNALIHWDFAMRTSEKEYSKSQIDSIG